MNGLSINRRQLFCRPFLLTFAFASFLTATLHAGINGTWSLVPDSISGLGGNESQWAAYTLGLATDDGSRIAAVDITLHGLFHERWSLSEDTGAFEPTPAGSQVTGADSHLMPIASALTVIAPHEDNNVLNDNPFAPPLPKTATADNGVGSTLSGLWGIPGSDQTSSTDFAYVVVPRNVDWSQYHFDIGVSTSNGPSFDSYTMHDCNFMTAGCGFTAQTQPVPAVTPSATNPVEIIPPLTIDPVVVDSPAGVAPDEQPPTTNPPSTDPPLHSSPIEQPYAIDPVTGIISGPFIRIPQLITVFPGVWPLTVNDPENGVVVSPTIYDDTCLACDVGANNQLLTTAASRPTSGGLAAAMSRALAGLSATEVRVPVIGNGVASGLAAGTPTASSATHNLAADPAPEPATLSLLVLALIGTLGLTRRR